MKTKLSKRVAALEEALFKMQNPPFKYGDMVYYRHHDDLYTLAKILSVSIHHDDYGFWWRYDVDYGDRLGWTHSDWLIDKPSKKAEVVDNFKKK